MTPVLLRTAPWAALYAATVVVLAAAVAVRPVLGAGVLLGAAAAFAVWQQPVRAAYALVALVPLTAGLQRGVPLPGLRLSEVLTVGLAALVLVLADHRRDARWRLLDWAALLFVVAHAVLGGLATRRTAGMITTEELGVLVGPLQFFLFYRALALTLQTPERRRTALRLLLWTSAVVSLSAIGQAAVPAVDTFVRSLTGYALESTRATGLFPHFQVLSAYLAAILVLGTAAVVHRVLVPWQGAVVLGLAAIALVLTVTITTMTGALLGCLAVAAWHPQGRRNLAIGLVCLAAVAVPFLPILAGRAEEQSSVAVGTVGAERSAFVPQTVAYRWEIWTTQSLPVLQERLALGWGATLPASVAWRSTESMYITLLFRGGLVLLAVWALMWLALVRTGWQRRRSADVGQRAAARALVVVLGVLLVMQFIQPYLTYGGVSHVVWLLAAVVAVPAKLAASR